MASHAPSCLLVSPQEIPDPAVDVASRDGEQRAILAGGCFWCTEAVFVQLRGVAKVTSGYCGGSAETADYRTVCTGTTGHAEVIEVRYDPAVITFGQLLKVFFSVAHDPTQLNQQGADRGTQYRSAIFPVDPEQSVVAMEYIKQLNESQAFKSPIVTSVEPLFEVSDDSTVTPLPFYPAETYHHNYAALNPDQPYIAGVAMPKVDKVRTYFDPLINKK